MTLGGTQGPVAVVAFSNVQATGQAHLVKTCADDGSALAGAEFDVVAQEQITSPDGSVQAVAGEVVDHVVTDTNGRPQRASSPSVPGRPPMRLLRRRPLRVMRWTPHRIPLP